MPNEICLPTLDETGWLYASAPMADRMLSHFFVSDYNQTNEYYGEVASLPWIIQDNQGDIPGTTRAIRTTLERYFSRYFNSVTVEVSEVPNDQDPGKAQLAIYLSFTDSDGVEHSVGKMIRVMNTVIEEIIDINNG